MDDRYEMRGKVGQGGIGSVHRAFDRKLKREVAIKRILTSEDDPNLEEEATKQMIAEARALASLQHPHIVTILDVGSDSKGPYVVMELLTGNTLDELIEKSPLTWDDFREVATQSLEAMIAAQELGMIHSDLKPPNIMLTWLPSGKFQVKVLDFGLAVLIKSQSQEEISKLESVYGSIFFMPPEQFERKTLDERSDLYSLGCCFYQALAGTYPFNGEDVAQVMEAHLKHTVTPIWEIRTDIPEWAGQWIMWLINCDREERPATARDALANFLQNEHAEKEALNKPKGPKLLVAGPGMAPPPQVTAAVTLPDQTGEEQADGSTEATPARKVSPKTLKIAAGVLILLLMCGTAWWLKLRIDRSRTTKIFTDLVAKASAEGVTQILLNGDKLKKVLEGMSLQKSGTDLRAACEALLKVEAMDDSDTDLIIAEFATSAEMPDSTRKQLFTDVLSERGTSKATPLLLGFAGRTDNPELAAAAMSASKGMVGQENAGQLLGILEKAGDAGVVEAAGKLMSEIISWSRDPKQLAKQIEASLSKAGSDTAKTELQRLQKLCASETQATKPKPPAPKPPAPKPTPATNTAGQSAETKALVEAVKSGDKARILEALKNVGKTYDNTAHGVLIDQVYKNKDDQDIRTEAIKAFIRVNSHRELLDGGDAKGRWWQVRNRAQTAEQKTLVIEGLEKINQPWVAEELRALTKDSEVGERAKQALEKHGKGG